ncbi:SphA family protein [Salinicola endophyticus]|nr:transporter [Salinicola endophyticus]
MTCAASSFATENGAPTTPMGVYEFGSGFLPPTTPNGTIGLRTAYYTADDLRTRGGKRSPNDFSLDVLSVGVAYIRMTDKRLFGARYGFGGVLPFFDMKASLDVNAGGQTVFQDDTHVLAQADVQIVPLMLAWQPAPNMGVSAQFQIQAPTGEYDKDRLVNPGLNHWTFSPIVGFTYVTQGGLEFSTLSQFDVNTRNTDTDYRSGVEYRNEFGIGQHVDVWTLGLGGYYYDQISDDKSPSLTIDDGNRARVWAAGPAVSFLSPGLPAVWFHVYKEFGAENRTEGYNAAVRVAYSF